MSAATRFGEIVARYNRRIGTPFQRFASRIVVLYLLGPLMYVLLRLLLRIRIVGRENLTRAGRRTIVAARHFHEWDPIVTGYALFWPAALRRPWFAPTVLAGKFWLRTRIHRAISYHLGILGIVRGEGPEQGAIRRAGELLAREDATPILLFPTGPVGLARTYAVKPGIGHLAVGSPETPVVPVAVHGVQGLRLRALLTLRRPVVTFVIGAPFRAVEHEGTLVERIAAVSARVAASWEESARPML